MTIAFIGVGKYTGRLLRGLFGKHWTDRDDHYNVNIYDIDRCRLNYVFRQLENVKKKLTLAEAIKNADIIIIGVPFTQIRTVLNEIRIILGEKHTSLLIMDGSNPVEIVNTYTDFNIGAIMFNHFVQVRSGVIGLWRGTLSNDVVIALQNVFSCLGIFKLVSNPEKLKIIRVVAGVGSGILLQFLNNLEENFVALGITHTEANQFIKSLLEGTVACIENSETIRQVFEEIKDNHGIITAEALKDLDSNIYNENTLKKIFLNALTRIKEITVI